MLKKNLFVKTVARHLLLIWKDIVQTLASLLGVENLGSIMKQESVNNAGKSLLLTNMQEQKPVRNPVLTRIVSIRSVGKQDVYNMEVKKHHNFSVSGGLIVHNCIRYATEHEQGTIHRSAIKQEKETFDYGKTYKRIGVDENNGGWLSA